MNRTRVHSSLLSTVALAGAWATLPAWAHLVAQGGGTQQGGQAPSPSVNVEAPIERYDCIDVEPGTDPLSAQIALRELKQRMAREWSWVPEGAEEGDTSQFQIDPGSPDRWGNPTAYGQPEVITWSLAPDTAEFFPGQPHQLFGWMNTQFGSTIWISQIEQAFQNWSDLTGITFVRVRSGTNEWDDGAPYGSGGLAGARGDIRIFAFDIADPLPANVLALAEPPGGIVPNPSPGEITFDLESWATTPWNPAYGFERTIHHEIGHAIGLAHSCPSNDMKLMQPDATPTLQFGTPQHDDVRGAQALYGDPLEPNDTREQASFFQIYPLFSPNLWHPAAYFPTPEITPFTGGILSIDNGNDHDWFEFGIVAGMDMTIRLIPVGGSYQDWPQVPGSDPTTFACPPTGPTVNSAIATPLNLQIWRSIDANDDTLLQSASSFSGSTAQISTTLKYAGRYRVHVYGTSTPIQKQSQQYRLEISWASHGCSGASYCSDGNPTNGAEICSPTGPCLFAYVNNDYNYDSIPDSMQSLADCNSNGRADVGETAYHAGGMPRAKVRGQDDCANAQPVAAGVDYEYTPHYASADPGSGSPSSSQPGVWFRYTPQTNGVVSIQVRGHQQVPLDLTVRAGGCNGGITSTGSSPEFDAFGMPIGQLAELRFESLANVELRIRVSQDVGYPYPISDFILRIEGPDDVTNDCNKDGQLDVCQAGAPDCNSNGIIDTCELVGATNHCILSENRSGPGAIISASGSLSVQQNNLTLVVEGANPNTTGIFIASPNRIPLPQEGMVCLDSPILRLGSASIAQDGTAFLTLDLTQHPQMSAGSTWNFQFWFRDIGGPGIGMVGANVSDAIELKLCQ